MHPAKDYRPDIELAAKQYDLDPDLVEAIVRVESSGLTHAFRHEPQFYRRYLADDPSYAGELPIRVASSYGLMQVMYPVAREHQLLGPPEYLFVPSIGLDFGCKHLRWLFDRLKGDRDAALVAYNGGLGNARRPFKPQHSIYLSKVLTALSQIQGEQ